MDWVGPLRFLLFLALSLTWGIVTVALPRSSRPATGLMAVVAAGGILIGLLPHGLLWLFAPSDWVRSMGSPEGLMMETYSQVVAGQNAVVMLLLLAGLWAVGAAIAWPVRWLLTRLRAT